MAISKKVFLAVVALTVILLVVREMAFHVKLIAPPPSTNINFTQKPVASDTVVLISLKASISALVNKVNAALPRNFSDSERDPTDWLTEDTSSFSIYRRDIQGGIDGNRLRLDMPLYNGTATIKGVFGVKRKNKGLLGELEKLMSKEVSGSVKEIDGVVTFWTAPALTTNWTINPNANINVNVTNAEIKVVNNKIASVTGLVEKKINKDKDKMLQDMNNMLASSQLIKGPVAKLWRDGFITQRLDKNEHAWLVVTPTKVISKPITFHDGFIDVAVGVVASTKILHQIEEPSNPVTELPPLDVNSAVEPGVHLNLPIAISFDLLNEAFERNIEGLKLESDGYEIEFNKVKVASHGDKLVISMDITGEPNWWRKTTVKVNFQGRPHLEVGRRELSVVDLDFDTNSKDMLVNSAAWLLKPVILQKLSELLNVDLSEVEKDVIEKAANELDNFKNKFPKELELDANLESLTLKDIRVLPDVVYLIVGAAGSVTLSADEIKL